MIALCVDGRLKDERERPNAVLPKEGTEATLTDVAPTDVFVPICSTVEFALRIVEVDDMDVTETHRLFKEFECPVDGALRPEVITRSEGVACIETDANPLLGFDSVEEEAEIVDGRAIAVFLARRVLQQDRDVVRLLSQRALARTDDAPGSKRFAASQMTPKVCDQVSDAQLAAPSDLSDERLHRLLVQRLDRRGEIRQVRHVCDDRVEARRLRLADEGVNFVVR